MADFKFISADGHLNDPPAAREESKRNTEIGPQSRERSAGAKGSSAPDRWARPFPLYNPSVGFLVAKPKGVPEIDLNQVADATITHFRESFRYEDHPGSWEPSARLKEQDRDGVERRFGSRVGRARSMAS